jgi:dihydrofolate reductase
MTQIVGIVAIAKNNAIGKNGKLPWHYSADLKFFKATTTDNVIVMGRTTFESIGKPLPNRLNIVLSHKSTIESAPSLLCAKSKEEVLAIAKYLNCKVFIIGGASIYKEFSDVVDTWIVTEIPETVADADVFMAENFLDQFEATKTIKLDEELNVKIYERSK